MTTLSCDFETRSEVDIRRAGAYAYAAHCSTDILCFAFAWNDDEPELWLPGQPVPERIRDEQPDEVRAWNAGFERLIWRHILGPRYGWPVPELEQYHDTAAEAAAMALPRDLNRAATVLRVNAPKDAEGHRIMLQLCKPRKPTKTNPDLWWTPENAPEKFARLYEYCRQDVRAERAVARRLRRLSAGERELWLLDARVNDRGVLLDMPLLRASQEAVAVGLDRANRQLREVTAGEVSSVTKVAELTRWLQRESSYPVENLRKDTVRDLLAEDSLEEKVRSALELRADAGRSSLAKLSAMDACRGDDDRMRGLLMYHGAATGRWAGRLAQPQNFPRPPVKKPERFIPFLLDGDYDLIDLEESPLAVVASLLRGCMVAAPGHRFLCGDFSQIEARVLAWLAGQEDQLAQLSAGKAYEYMAAAITRKPVEQIGKDSPERQLGKVTVLGAGYGMGPDTFRAQTWVQWGLALSEKESHNAIGTYRELNHRIQSMWYALDDAAKEAVRCPGRVSSAGRDGDVRFLCKGQWLWCVLPSGRPLAYALPSVVMRETKYGARPQLRVWGVNSYTRQWGPYFVWGGLLAENITQAASRDLLASAMLRVERAGYPVVLTVHDEILAEVPEGEGALPEFLSLMRRTPKWAQSCPVDAEGWEGPRYRK